MKDPKDFKSVTYKSYTFITLINALFGGMVYLYFGAATAPNALSNLPSYVC